MNNSPSFFSDPKVILSLLALIMSFGNLIWTLVNQWEQNRRWDNLNTANIVIKEIKMIKRKELTKEEALKTNWGYNPSIYSLGEASNLFQIPYCLNAHELSTKKTVEGLNVVFTIQEIEEELKRISYTNKVFITKLFKPLFTIENSGKTNATDLMIEISVKLPNEEWRSAFKSTTQITLASSQSSNVTFDIELPIELQLPEAINFKVNFSFKDVNYNSIKNEIKAKWTSMDNYWSYGEI